MRFIRMIIRFNLHYYRETGEMVRAELWRARLQFFSLQILKDSEQRRGLMCVGDWNSHTGKDTLYIISQAANLRKIFTFICVQGEETC